jgi:hypothetical protein
MQKNCTEFIAYENIVPDASTGSGSSRAQSRDGRGRSPKQEKGERPKSNGSQSIDQAAPLVMRALKVLTDREVTPQLGLLKSTLLQLDSSFSERDYGAGSFREFADKLAKQGLVSLKHQGRSTLVELPDSNPSTQESPQAATSSLTAHASNGGNGGGQAKADTLTELLEQPDSVPQDASLGDGVALVRRVLTDATTQPRWPMYPRQFKQFLRSAQPDFDERKYGSIADLMRACQKDGLLRLERDRQGALRVFASGGAPRASVPHGWGVAIRENGSEQTPETSPVVDVVPEVIAAPVVDAQITEVVEEPLEAPRAKRKTAPRRKAATKTAKRTRTTKKVEN